MSKKLLFLLFAFLWLHATAGYAAAIYPSNAAVLMEDNCNLPGPSNLTNTGATTTSLAFAWDPVAGSNGYEILLSEVVTGDPIYSDHIFTESVNITGLNPDTEYELKVWSVCSNGGLGGYSAIIARTDYVIVEDIITTRQFNNEVQGNNFPLYADNMTAQDTILFKIKAPNGKSTLFETEKNTTPVQNANFIHRVEFNHENGSAEDRLEWILGVSEVDAPFRGDKQNMDAVNVYHEQEDGKYERVMVLYCPRDSHNYSTTLVWVADDASGYELVMNEDSGFSGGSNGGGGKNRSKTANPEQNISVGPNPFRDILLLSTPHDTKEKSTVTLIEPVSGRVLFQTTHTGGQLSLPVEQLSAGAYLIRYETSSATQSFKVIKTN